MIIVDIYKAQKRVWMIFYIVLICSSEWVGGDEDNDDKSLLQQLYSVQRLLLPSTPSLKQLGTVNLVLGNGKHISSIINWVLFGTHENEKNFVPSNITIYLAGGFKLVIDKTSLKILDKNGNLLMKNKLKEMKIYEEGKKINMSILSTENKEEIAANKSEETVARWLQTGAIKMVRNQRYRPPPCTMRTGIYGSYNPCLTPAGTMMKNFWRNRGTRRAFW